MESVNVNLDNLTQSEREQLMKLVEKGNGIKGKVWKPEKGESYWAAASEIMNFVWNDDEVDLFYYSIGNCYPTEEAAEFAIEKQKVLTELQRYADEHNEGEIDWSNHDTNKYNICYDHEDNDLFITSNQYLQNLVAYFTSYVIAENAIKAIGVARIKKYLFNIED